MFTFKLCRFLNCENFESNRINICDRNCWMLCSELKAWRSCGKTPSRLLIVECNSSRVSSKVHMYFMWSSRSHCISILEISRRIRNINMISSYSKDTPISNKHTVGKHETRRMILGKGGGRGDVRRDLVYRARSVYRARASETFRLLWRAICAQSNQNSWRTAMVNSFTCISVDSKSRISRVSRKLLR